MKALAPIKNWLIKHGLAPSPLEQKPVLQQLEELVARTAKAGHGEEKSRYYTHPHGQFADFKDFDTDRMIEDFSTAFPTITKDDVRRVVMHGIYYHYLR